VIEVKEGSYDKPEIGFDFPVGSKPPLEIGETYLFKAVYDRHGIRYTEWTKTKKTLSQRYLMVKRILAVLPSLTTLMM
jgi:hypothetical protein